MQICRSTTMNSDIWELEAKSSADAHSLTFFQRIEVEIKETWYAVLCAQLCISMIMILTWSCDLKVFLPRSVSHSQSQYVGKMQGRSATPSNRKTREGFMSHTFRTPPLTQSKPNKQLPSSVCARYTNT